MAWRDKKITPTGINRYYFKKGRSSDFENHVRKIAAKRAMFILKVYYKRNSITGKNTT